MCDRSVSDVKAALEANGGDVDKALAQLMTPQELAQRQYAKRIEGGSSFVDRLPPFEPVAPYVPADERDVARVLADFEAAARRHSAFLGAATTRVALPVPPALAQLLERWNGVDISASARLWGTEHPRNAPALDDSDIDALPIGEHDDLGYLFVMLGQADTYFFAYNEPSPVTHLAKSFESFLRDWINHDLDLIAVIGAAERRARR